MLSPNEQLWFALLSVFFGGWTIEAVEAMMQAWAVSRGEDWRQLRVSGSALNVLTLLLDNNLLVQLPVAAEQARFTMLETLREFALERLKERGKFARLRDWHARYYLEVAEEGKEGMKGARQLMWHARLVGEQENFRAALEWSLQRAGTGASMAYTGVGAEMPALEVCLRMAAALRPYWEWQGYLVEGRDWLEAVLALPLDESAGKAMCAARARALSEAARLVCLQNEQTRAIDLAEESIQLWRQLDDPMSLAIALLYRAWPAIALGEYELATSLLERGQQLLSPTGDVWLRAQLLFHLGAVAGLTNNFEQMHILYAQSKALFEQAGDQSAIADLMKDQGGMAILEGHYSESIANLLKSLELSHELGYKQFVGTGLGLLGYAVGLSGEPDALTASLQAARIWGASQGLLGAIGSTPWLVNHPTVQEAIVRIRMRVDDESWKAAWREGRSLTEEQALATFLASNRASVPR